MRLSQSILLATGALSTGAFSLGVHRRTIESAQDCIAGIQTAEEAMDSALKGLSSKGADPFPQSIQGVEQAMSNAATMMKSVQPLSGADAQTFMSAVDDMCSSVKLTAMSLMLQQPMVESMGLMDSAMKSLASQREMVDKLSKTAATKVGAEMAPAVQRSFGEAMSAVDLCLGQMQGGGSVVVEMGGGGQAAQCGAEEVQQQCMDMGFAPINDISNMQGMAEQDQEKLVQYCDAMGMVPAEQCMEAPAEEEQPPAEEEQAAPEQDNQDLEQQCMDAGLVKQDEAQGASQDAVQQCAAIGYVAGMDDAGQNDEAAKPGDGGAAQVTYRLRKRTQLVAQPAAPAGDHAGGEQAGGEQAGEEQAGGEQAGGEEGADAGQDDLAQQCAAIGFVEQQAGEEFEASPEACAGMGLVEGGEGQDMGQEQDMDQGEGQDMDQEQDMGQGEDQDMGQEQDMGQDQDIAQQCAALGLQPSGDAGGDEMADEGDDQQNEGDDQQNEEDDQQNEGDDAAAEEENENEGDDAAEGQEQEAGGDDKAAEGKKQRRTRRSPTRRTDEAAAGQEGAEGQVSKEDCLAMGFVEMGGEEQGEDGAADEEAGEDAGVGEGVGEGAGEDAGAGERAGEDAGAGEGAGEDAGAGKGAGEGAGEDAGAGAEAGEEAGAETEAQQPSVGGDAAAAPPAAAGTYRRSSHGFRKWRI